MFIVTSPKLIEQLPWWTGTVDNPWYTPWVDDPHGDGDGDVYRDERMSKGQTSYLSFFY